MKLHANTGVEEKEQWRERITRALLELRSGDERICDAFRPSRDDGGGDAAADSAKL